MSEFPIHNEIQKGDLEQVKSLIQNNVNTKDSEDRTPLHIVIDSTECNKKEIEFLLKYGADIITQDDDGFSPLHLAIGTENIDIIQLFLEQGANVNINNKFESTPLH